MRKQHRADRGSWVLRGDDAPVQPAVAAALPVAVIAAPADCPCTAPLQSPVRRLVTPSASCLHPPRLRSPLPASLLWTLLLLLLGSSHFLPSECGPVQVGRREGSTVPTTNVTLEPLLGGSIIKPPKILAPSGARLPTSAKDTQPASAPDSAPSALNNKAPLIPDAPAQDRKSLVSGHLLEEPSMPIQDVADKDMPSTVTQPSTLAADRVNKTDAPTTTGNELGVALVPPVVSTNNSTTDSTTTSTTAPTTSKAPSTTSTPKSKSSGEKVPIKRPTQEKDGPQIKAPPADPQIPAPLNEDMDMEKEEEGGAGLPLDEEEDRELRPAGGKTHDLQGMVAAPREVHLNEKALLAVDDGQNHAFGYFVVLLVGSVALIAFWRKRQRILAYLIEGRRSSGRRRTGSRAGGGQVQYRKLHAEED